MDRFFILFSVMFSVACTMGAADELAQGDFSLLRLLWIAIK
jgi:hypothetical protein